MPEKPAQGALITVTLAGDGIEIEKSVSEDKARMIMNILMGGASQQAPPAGQKPGAPPVGDVADTGQGLTAKQFMATKRPKSDMERVACLAFYLTYSKATPTFKTKDIEELNRREASQPPFPDPKVAVNNATRNGYLAPAGEGKKQITARGEELVKALPDREAVKKALAAHPLRKRRKRPAKKQ